MGPCGHGHLPDVSKSTPWSTSSRRGTEERRHHRGFLRLSGCFLVCRHTHQLLMPSVGAESETVRDDQR